ncbi:hypothetical protein MADA3029_1140150 [Vibrio nigripulchritudo MADA3029]|nr:hypothetical protein VIBNIMADA3020_10151 [Vibrio nigripulchritudo MADA3020]CCN53965.1 hypothetical protein VIBNIMADA3021_460033 [Vibrio nigripulchritudo MADA3021]CCN57594.1 hypothetical protein MADA3029_1140150 [Vibrio nigripulchritudo MADA3029]CCN69045.1 hypothetical protein VIBNISFn118_1190025 [Vibrio nigripulchritudo SFn118]
MYFRAPLIKPSSLSLRYGARRQGVSRSKKGVLKPGSGKKSG